MPPLEEREFHSRRLAHGRAIHYEAQYYEGKAGAEYLVRIKRCPSTGAVIYSSRVSAATYMCF